MSLVKINIGPVHPSTHGLLRLVVTLDGDTIVNVEPHVGFLHRGVEKLAENRMYMQIPPFIEKCDYVAKMAMDEAYVATVEAAMGIEPNERAQYERVILLELQRIASHLLWLGAMLNDLGHFFSVFMWTFADRDKVLKLLEEATGQRMFYVNMRLGGLRQEFPKDFEYHALDVLTYLEKRINEYESFIENSSLFKERMYKVGVLSRDDAINLGVSGPVLRASGVNFDVRKDKPYYVYKKLNFKPIVLYNGDNFSRYKVRILEIKESIRLIREAFKQMPDGNATGMPIKLINPAPKNKVVRVSREGPRGEIMFYLVADEQRPYRLAMRTPAFINLAALNHIARGNKFANLFPIIGSLDLVMADVDK